MQCKLNYNVMVFSGKGSILTPLTGYESFTLHFSNHLSENSYAGHAETIFGSYGFSAVMEATKGINEFEAKANLNINNHDYITFKSTGRIDSIDSFKSELKLKVPMLPLLSEDDDQDNHNPTSTPKRDSFSIDAFIHMDKSYSIANKGFGLKVNDEQIFLFAISEEGDGTTTLSFLNPWTPGKLSYAMEHSSDLINYQASSTISLLETKEMIYDSNIEKRYYMLHSISSNKN